MNCCLLLGSILLIATVVSFPLYQTAAYDRMLQDEFRDYLSVEGKWPTKVSLVIQSKNDEGGGSISRAENLFANMSVDFGVTEEESIRYYLLAPSEVSSAMGREVIKGLSLRLAMRSNLPAHAEILSGEMYSDTGLTEDGSIEVVVSEAAMVKMNLLVGETLIFKNMKDADGNEIRLYVKGVYGQSQRLDDYWQESPEDMTNVCLMNEELFRRMFTGENAGKFSVTCQYHYLFEYSDITAPQVKHLMERTDYLTDESPYRSIIKEPDYRQTLETYTRKQDRIRATLVILQVPVLILLGAFLFMISGQMYEMERNEISVIKSRGSSGGQIFRLYLYQSLFLTLVGGAVGIPLGSVFSMILGSASNFLEFDGSRTLEITYTPQTWIYAGAAMLITMLSITIPAIRHSRVTIVNLKQQKALKKKRLWEKLCLDVILLGVSLYGYYNFHKNSAELGNAVLRGETLDPLLYISSSLFILGMGLLFLRLQPYIVQLIYMVGKRFWKPASYASFMENAKNGRKQQFIMLFLIMTIALGMYHATVARTILRNASDNAEYLDGADVVLREVWRQQASENGAATGVYIEPDFTKYASMEGAENYTKVINNTEAFFVHKDKGSSLYNVSLMGIHTKEFGEITWVSGELNQKHYYEYLNELAVAERGLLVSRNFQTILGYEVGDSVTVQVDAKDNSSAITGKIVDFFDYWPGYAKTETELNPDGTTSTNENYLVVTHYNLLYEKWGLKPYEVWISLKDGYDSRYVYDWIQEKDVRIAKYVNRADDRKAAVEDPLLQGTNGVLTMGFLVTILLCAVGYLIYWIMSIRSREMIFGVLRACGMHKGELIHMLLNEQIFSGVFTVFAGIGIGKLTSVMFVPMLQQAYAATNQVLPMKLITETSDMMRLYLVIAGVMIVCLVVLITLLFKLNVTKALKLGEE